MEQSLQGRSFMRRAYIIYRHLSPSRFRSRVLRIQNQVDEAEKPILKPKKKS